MTDDNTDDESRRKALADMATLSLGGTVDINSVSTQATIGTQGKPVDVFLTEDSLDWLFNVLGEDGTAHVDTVSLETNRGTIEMCATGNITLTLSESDNSE